VRVPYVDLPAQYAADREEILAALDRTLASGRYILGEEVERFERDLARICGVDHTIAVGNGTDALILALLALEIGPGDEVITAANSWVSTAASIALVGAKPVFAEVEPDQNLDPESVRAVMSPATKAILPVHLTGRCADMGALAEIAAKAGVAIIEDAAQAVGARYRDRPAGSMGALACFSMHPLKNLNAAGDAGAITTNDAALAEKLRLWRNHGLERRNQVRFWGHNSRLDALQAAILNVRSAHLDAVIAARRAHAARYLEALVGLVDLPPVSEDRFDTYHLFVIQTDARDALKAHLKAHGISSAIHYPIPIHLQTPCREMGYAKGDLPATERQAQRILSLPVHHMLTTDQVDHVIETICSFFSGS